MSKHRILAVDDDWAVRAYLLDFLTARGYDAECLDSGEQVMARVTGRRRPALVVLDLLMPEANGLDILARIRKLPQPPPVIVLSGVGHVGTVVKAAKLGAADYLLKPFEDQELELAIENALGAAGEPEARPLPRESRKIDLLSVNPRVLRIREIVSLVADTDVPVLICGESGAGKEVVARLIHEDSSRCGKPLVKINCAALPADLLESELFGHEKGAFTGAVSDKPGHFEMASGGAIFLDEIGEMKLSLQAKLLHVLQDGEFTRLGGTTRMRTDARVIAATNKPLEEAVASGEFRSDLYFRLNVIQIEVPPLRERLEDLPLLCGHFLEKYGARYGQDAPELPPTLMAAFRAYDWPGNIRQLENVIRRYLILRDPDLLLADLKPSATAQTGSTPAAAQPGLSLKERSAKAAEETEREAILAMLDQTNWNRKEAARRLGMCYKSLLQKLRKWGIGARPSPAAKRAAG